MLLRSSPEKYKGNVIAAAPGTHAAVSSMVAKYCKPGAKILDLGAYTGALLERLHDAGYPDITAADLDNHLTIQGVSHIKCDFNQEFSTNFQGAQFDCVIASEVIEHLDDVRAFLRECAKLTKEGGLVVISTPNIGFFEGRIKFLLKGELWGFGGHNYRVQRHISPLSLEQFPLLLEETGFETVEVFTAASFATPVRKLLTSVLWLPMRLLLGPAVLGESAVCVGRRSSGAQGHFMSTDLWKKDDISVK
jgi:ubiquinone/menaquinone biosynthesis C-methylase UbiE